MNGLKRGFGFCRNNHGCTELFKRAGRSGDQCPEIQSKRRNGRSGGKYKCARLHDRFSPEPFSQAAAEDDEPGQHDGESIEDPLDLRRGRSKVLALKIGAVTPTIVMSRAMRKTPNDTASKATSDA